MKILKLVQGSQEWLDIRKEYPTASEAAAMMGESPYMTRDELLLQKFTGESKEVSSSLQKVFDNGHRIEALARPFVEAAIEDDLYPVVAVNDVGGIEMLASVDGLTMLGDIAFECKQYNEKLNESVAKGVIPDFHKWQLEQIMAVTGAKQVLFTVSGGARENTKIAIYLGEPSRRRKLIAGWKQFYKDLAEYSIPEKKEKIESKEYSSLPVIHYSLNGLSVESNIRKYKDAALKLVEESKKPLVTDQDFADRDALCKVFKDAESRIKRAQEKLISETGDINDFVKTLSEIGGFIREARLNSEKMIKPRKEELKQEAIANGNNSLLSYIKEVFKGVNPHFIPAYSAGFEQAIKHKKTLESVKSSINDRLAQLKMQVNQDAEKIRVNVALLNSKLEYKMLFCDAEHIVLQEPESFAALVESRIAEHKKAEEKRLEAERQRIRAEEEFKAKEKADHKLKIQILIDYWESLLEQANSATDPMVTSELCDKIGRSDCLDAIDTYDSYYTKIQARHNAVCKAEKEKKDAAIQAKAQDNVKAAETVQAQVKQPEPTPAPQKLEFSVKNATSTPKATSNEQVLPTFEIQSVDEAVQQVVLTINQHAELVRKADLFDALMANGVERWIGYRKAVQSINKASAA